MDLLIDIVTRHGWKALVIALFTFTLIELIKPFARKTIKKEGVRHTLYTILNYIFTLGLSALLAVLVTDIKDTFRIYGSSIVVVNILYPVIANVGFFRWIEKVVSELIERTSESGLWKKALKELFNKFGLDTEFADKIADKIEEEYADKIKGVAFFLDNKDEVLLNIRQKLAGFVDSGKLQEIAEGLFWKLAESWDSEGILKSNK